MSGSNVVDPDGNSTETSAETLTTTEGTTVQLPTFAFTSVSTTVSVPDGDWDAGQPFRDDILRRLSEIGQD